MKRRLGLLSAAIACALTMWACGPNGEGPGPGGAPPEEAYTACTSKKAGDACETKMGDQTMKGTCAAAEDNASDTRLSCRPAGGPKAP